MSSILWLLQRSEEKIRRTPAADMRQKDVRKDLLLLPCYLLYTSGALLGGTSSTTQEQIASTLFFKRAIFMPQLYHLRLWILWVENLERMRIPSPELRFSQLSTWKLMGLREKNH